MAVETGERGADRCHLRPGSRYGTSEESLAVSGSVSSLYAVRDKNFWILPVQTYSRTRNLASARDTQRRIGGAEENAQKSLEMKGEPKPIK